VKNTRTILAGLVLLAATAIGMRAREQKEPVNFGAQRIGSTVDKVVTIDLRVPGGPNFFVKDPSAFTHPFRVQPGSGPGGAYVVKDQQFLELRLSFHPTDDGDFTDTLILERPGSGNLVDKILVIAFGRGVRQPVKVIPVDYTQDDPSIYIGDSILVKRRVPFDKGEARRFRQISTTSLGSPFELVISPTQDLTPNEIILGASFEPRAPGVYRDTLAFERIDSVPGVTKPVVLDTIAYLFYGVAKQQLAKVELDFNLVIGDAPKEITGSFIVESSLPYEYGGSSRTSGPCAFVKAGNVSQTGDLDKVEYTVRCTPTAVGQFVDTLVIKRFNKDKEVVDQTLVVCTTNVRPRPLVLTIALTPATAAAKVGDTVSLAIIATADHVPDVPATVLGAQFVFSYNASVLIPITSSTVSTDRIGDTSTVTLTLDQKDQVRLVTGTDTIGVLRFVVALGTADTDVVQPLLATLNAEQTEIKTYVLNAATISVSDIWEHEGGPRLVNSLRGPCNISVDPNPVRTTAVMKLTNVPTDVGTFHIVSTNGAVVKDLSNDVRLGVREFSISSGSGASIALSPGTYYARLFVGANGKTVYSVVRMIVVE